MGSQFPQSLLPQLQPIDDSVPHVDVHHFHTNYDTYIFDADGVLWLGNQPIPGAAELIAELTRAGKRVIILTNNSTHSLAFYAEKCRQLGINVGAENIVSAAFVCAHELRKMRAALPEIADLPIYLVGSAELRDILQSEVGVECFGPGPDHIESYTDKTFLMDMDVTRRVAAVVTSFDSHLSYPKVMRAVNYLRDPNVAYIATNEDLTFPGHRPEVVVPGAGTVSVPIRAISGRQPTVMGKPESAAYDYMRERYGIEPTRTVMIGDRCDTDIAFGRRNGLATLLVLSGVNTLVDVAGYRSAGSADCLPDMYAPSVHDLLQAVADSQATDQAEAKKSL